MRRPSLALTDPQCPAISVRDRATRCFGEANLWLLDSRQRPARQTDWVGPVLPACRGGRPTLENRVAPCHLYNGKKRGKGADASYLFERGSPLRGRLHLSGCVCAPSARLKELGVTVAPLSRAHERNAGLWYGYFYDAQSDAERRRALRRAERSRRAPAYMLACMRSDWHMRAAGIFDHKAPTTATTATCSRIYRLKKNDSTMAERTS